MGCDCGAESQKVTPPRAAPGGRSSNAEQLQELDVVAVGNTVQPVDELIDHHRERLDQRDAGIGDVVVGPRRAALLHEPPSVVHQALKGPVVKVR